MSFEVPARVNQAIDEVITHYPERRSASLMVLHELQDHFGFLSREAIEWTARKLELEPIHLYELVTFYPMFRQEPAGRYILKICRTLSCALAGSKTLHRHLCRKFNLPAGAGTQTSADGKFSVEFVECLAACGTPPVMMCNDTFYDNVTVKKADEIVASCK